MRRSLRAERPRGQRCEWTVRMDRSSVAAADSRGAREKARGSSPALRGTPMRGASMALERAGAHCKVESDTPAERTNEPKERDLMGYGLGRGRTSCAALAVSIALASAAGLATASAATGAPAQSGAPAQNAAAAPATAPAVPALTVDEIVARHVEARGGAARLAAIRSLRLTGTSVFGGGDFRIEAEWALVVARPGRLRSELSLQGLTNDHRLRRPRRLERRAVRRPARRAEDVGRRGEGPRARGRHRRAARRLAREGPPGRVPRHRGRGRHAAPTSCASR